MITPANKLKIQQVVNCFETGSVNGNYGMLVKYPDGPGGIRQITFGRSQTTEFGNLKLLLQDYVNDNGTYAAQIKPYLAKIGKKPSLCDDVTFCKLLKDAGSKDPIMQRCQDDFFDSLYYNPAYGWFQHMGFTQPLSLLVIYDSHIHSGSVPQFLRNKFAEKVPASGGNEESWIKQYVNARHDWLTNNPKALLRKTNYRTQCFKTQVQKNNWDLSQPVSANGIKVA